VKKYALVHSSIEDLWACGLYLWDPENTDFTKSVGVWVGGEWIRNAPSIKPVKIIT
jgi:hypothetical protein